MKITKNILLFSFSLMLLGLFSKVFLLFSSSSLILVIGLIMFLVSAIVYGILALVTKQFRIEAGMIALPIPLVTGIIFSLLHWPAGGVLVVFGSGIMVMGSVFVLGYCLSQTRNVPLGLLYFSIGIGSLFFCFKFMRWPGALMLFIPTGICIVFAIGNLIFNKVELTISKVVSIIIIVLILLVFISSSSKLYQIKHLSRIHQENNFPENYYTYAWILKQEGKLEEAKINLKICIYEAQNPMNIQRKRNPGIGENLDPNFMRYERALELLNGNKWDEFEEPEFNRF